MDQLLKCMNNAKSAEESLKMREELVRRIQSSTDAEELVRLKNELLNGSFYFPSQTEQTTEIAFETLNCNQEFHKKLQLTALIGFLHQLNKEWEPETYKWDKNNDDKL